MKVMVITYYMVPTQSSNATLYLFWNITLLLTFNRPFFFSISYANKKINIRYIFDIGTISSYTNYIINLLENFNLCGLCT